MRNQDEAARSERLVRQAGDLGLVLASRAAAGLLAFLDAMLEANRELNLTAVRDPADAEVLHALDSLALGLCGLSPERCLEIGSGNGFPGIAAALLYPACEVRLMERTRKKAQILEGLIQTCGIANAAVLHRDAVQAPSHDPSLRRRFDLILARALGPPEAITRLATPLATDGARVVLWLTATMEPPVRIDDWRLERCLDYLLPEPTSRRRRLAVFGRKRTSRRRRG